MSAFTRPTRNALLLLLAVALLAPPALAQGGDGLKGRWWTIPRVIERLGLTPEQVDAIDEISFTKSESEIGLRADLQKANLSLLRLIDDPDLDEAAVDAAIDRVVSIRCDMARTELRARLDIAKVLTREQRMAIQRFAAVRERRGRR